MRKYLPILFAAMLLLSCRQQQEINNLKHSLCEYALLSAKDAKNAVCRDSMDAYFEKVNMLEMSIMLQMESPSGERKEVMKNYKELLQNDIEEFNAEEKKLLTTTFNKALDLCRTIDKNLNLPKIQLIKTKGSYYGAGVYYTRENNIIIPAGQLNSDNKYLLRTLIHEISHIYTRFNPKKKEALYALLGYNKLPNLELSDFLKKRVIYNPDGVDLAYAIEISDSSGRSFKAIPAMYSRFSSYRNLPLLKSFIFQLFEVTEKDAKWMVKNDGTGLSEEQINGYWEKIGRNTRYTIHPDEIIADNFTFLAISSEDKSEIEKFDEYGKNLLKAMKDVISSK
jgi:hypothetical protein